jgi:hypothetical protein
MKKLNLGCGTDIRTGWVNLDKFSLTGVDIVHDLSKLPLPFRDNEFGEILCQDVLEHLEYIPLLKELFRVSAKGCRLKIRVPHFTSLNNFLDPTHKKYFSFRTFDYFVNDTGTGRSYYFDFAFNRINYSFITFPKNLYFYNIIIEKLVNINNGTRKLYEGTFLSRLFPAENVLLELVK